MTLASVTVSTAAAARMEALLIALSERISPRRLLHVYGVAHTAAHLAERHRLGVDQAIQASLLHDLSKEVHPDELRKDLKRRGRKLPEEEHPYPRTWHGFHAAVLGEQEFGIDDRDVLEAVALHTTAEAEIGPLTRALFIADFTEPNRAIAEGPDVLALACRDLDQAFCRALDLKTRHMLGKKDFDLHPRTRRAMRRWLGINPHR